MAGSVTDERKPKQDGTLTLALSIEPSGLHPSHDRFDREFWDQKISVRKSLMLFGGDARLEVGKFIVRKQHLFTASASLLRINSKIGLTTTSSPFSC